MQSYCQHAVFVRRTLRLSWVVVVFLGEIWVFFWSLVECKWPFVHLETEVGQDEVSTKRVLLVADTQVQHPLLKDSSSGNPFQRLIFELNLRKSWYISSHLRPDVVIFLGDMISNGQNATTFQEYDAATQKFKSMFQVAPGTEVYYVPGNNDVGLGLNQSALQRLRSFYVESFGPLNRIFVIQNHTFVAIDSAGLVDEDYLRSARGIPFPEWTPLPGGTVAFATRVVRNQPDSVVLLSHIPLSRAESAHCGPLRERGTIYRGAGPGWQSTLGKQASSFLLKNLQPLIVFSADNRDYCDYTHILSYTQKRPSSSSRRKHIREITLKSFSTSVHIRRPGFHLLTLIDPGVLPRHQDSKMPSSLAESACFLPDQSRIYNALYAPLFAISVLVLAYFNFCKPNGSAGRIRNRPPSLVKASRSNSPSHRPSILNRTSAPGSDFFWSSTPISRQLPTIRMPQSPVASLPPYFSSTLRQSSSSTLSSTTTLLSGEDDLEGYNDLKFAEEDEDLIYPPQYAIYNSESVPGKGGRDFGPRRQHVRQASDAEFGFSPKKQHPDVMPDQEAALMDSPLAISTNESISAPEELSTNKRWTSFNFSLWGRRRQIRLGLPSWSNIGNLADFLWFGSLQGPRLLGMGHSRRRSAPSVFVADLLGVLWPAILVWVIVNGSMLL